MDKLIDDIIELILGDMDCHHEVDHDEDGSHVSTEYSLTGETKIRGMIGELIEQYDENTHKEVTKEWIQEKTVELIEIISKGKILEAMTFIRSIVKEIQ